MNSSFHFLLIAFLSFFVLSSGKNIIEYSKDDLEKAVNDGKQVVTLFYASWCSHCKRFQPTFKQVANSYNQYPNIIFAKLNCVDYIDFCRDQLVIKYPTIRLFKNHSMKPLYYEGPRKVPDYVAYISYHFNAPTTPADPIDLVKPIKQEEFTIRIGMSFPTVVLVQTGDPEDPKNVEAMKMIQHLATIYLIEPSIRFHYVTDTHSIDELSVMQFQELPTFVILFHNEIAVFHYAYNEYQKKKLLSEDAVIDFINDYADTDLTISGGRYTIPGRIPEVNKLIKDATAFDEKTVRSIREAVSKSGREYETSKRLYIKAIHLLKNEGMESVWKTLSELRETIRIVEAEEEGYDDDDVNEEENEEEEEEEGELEQLDDLEELVLYRNILRSFAKNIPVGPFENKKSPKQKVETPQNEMRVGEEEL